MAYNLTISTGADANVSRTTGANATTFTATGTGANANAAEISADGVSSSARKSVTVTTGSSGAEAGNITLAAPVSDGAGPGSAPIFDTLVLSAGGAVSQATSGTALVVNTLSVNAGGGVDLRDTGNVITQITGLTAGGDVMLVDSRQLQIDAVDVGSQHDITITVPVIDLGGGNGTSLRARDATFIGGAGGGVSVELYGSVQVRNLTLSGPNAVNLRAATTSGTANTYGIGGLLTITAPSGRIGGALTGAGTFEYASAGTLQLAGPVSLSGGVRIDAGVLQLVDPAAAIPNAQPSGEMGGSITGPVVDNGVLRFSRAGVTSYAGVISGSGAVTVDGGGNLGLSGANTYTGGTTVTASTVAVGHATAGVLDALGSGAVALNNATLFIGTPGVLTNPITVNGAATLGGGGFTLQSTISGAGSLTYNVPAVTLTGVDNRTQGATNLVFFVTVTATTPNSLSGVSDYNLASGTTLSIGSASQLSNTVFSIGSLSGAGTVQANQPGKTFALSVGATGASSTFSGVLTQTMGGFLQLSKVGAGVLTLTGANTYAGGANIGAGVLRIGNGGTTGSITGDVTDNAVLQFSRSDATPFAGAISGSGKVLVDSGGTLTLSAANTYSGGTTVTGGATLVANHADGATLNSDALGSGPVTLNNGVLAENDGTLIGNAVIVASGGGGLSGVGGNINIAGAISGSGPLTTSGPVFLNGDDSGFSGALTVASGQVSAGVANALSPNSAVSVAAGAVLRLGASQVIASLSGAGTVQGLVQGMGASLTTGGSGASTLFSGVLQGIGPGFPLALTKTGAGVFTLTGANTYTGATLVNGGVLAVDGSLTSAVTVASGGTLRGTGTDSAGVTVQAGGTFAPGEGAGAFTVGGALSLGANSTFADTATSATAYGTANVAGLVTLGGSLNFNVTSAAVLPVGTSFVLVHETGATAVAGAFANAADGGAYTTASGYTFRVSYSGGAGGHDVVLTETAAPSLPVTDTQTTSATTDKGTATPFAGVTVTDPAGGAETARITYAAANGALTLTGAGATLTGSAGAYTLTAASDAALNAALRALVFTPTPNQVAGGATVATTFTTSLSDAAGRMAGATDTTTVTGVNDAPTISGVPASATAPAAAPVTLAPSLTVADPDAGAIVRSGQVTITAGLTAGDVLTATPAAGITASYDAATGVLTLSGTASDAAYQQTLDTVAFRHDGPVAAGTRSVTFSVVDDQGVASNTAAETVNVSAVGGYTPPSAPMQTPSQAAGFTTQSDNLIRVAPSDTALNDPTSPIYAQAQAAAQIAARLDAGQLSAPDAQAALYHLVDGTTSVAEIAYAFFTGKTPTAAGLNYLVHSAANPTDLNDAYYARFSTENRYINFAANLATGAGAGAAQFQAAYGGLSLSDTVAKAYAAVFGIAPAPGKVDAILNAQVSNGLGGTETRAQYFADITGGSAQAQKAAAIGFLLADSVKEGFGAYQQADLHFLADLAHGTAAFNVDLLAAYGQASTLVGQPVLDPTLGS